MNLIRFILITKTIHKTWHVRMFQILHQSISRTIRSPIRQNTPRFIHNRVIIQRVLGTAQLLVYSTQYGTSVAIHNMILLIRCDSLRAQFLFGRIVGVQLILNLQGKVLNFKCLVYWSRQQQGQQKTNLFTAVYMYVICDNKSGNLHINLHTSSKFRFCFIGVSHSLVKIKMKKLS